MTRGAIYDKIIDDIALLYSYERGFLELLQ